MGIDYIQSLEISVGCYISDNCLTHIHSYNLYIFMCNTWDGETVSTWEVLCVFLLCLDKNMLFYYSIILIVVELLSHVRLFATPWTAARHCLSLSPLVCSNSCALSQWWYPAISSSVAPVSSWPQSFPASGSLPVSQLCNRWPKFWSFSFSISSSNKYSRLISFRMDWFDCFNN